MKNVGVLTHALADNFGANLQALSTACYLRNSGFNPIFFNWSPYPENENSEQVKLHSTFLERHGFLISKPCVSNDDFVDIVTQYDIRSIIVGSDCVFTYSNPFFKYILTRKGFKKKNILPDWQFPNPFWLPFYDRLDGVKTAVMSGSCGCSDLDKASPVVRRKMNRLLEHFSYISVRDEYTKHSLRKILGSVKSESISVTPDPVFGFNQNVSLATSKEEVLSKFNLPERYIVSSFYDNHRPGGGWLSCLSNIFNKNGYALINLPMPQGGAAYPYNKSIDLPLDPLDWYNIIKFSDGFIGNNMHPIIVAIHNGVPFFSINWHGKFHFHNKIQSVKRTKEYELLKKMDLLNYHIALKQIDSVNPSEVVERLLNFDRDYCKKCSSELYGEYKFMMDSILAAVI